MIRATRTTLRALAALLCLGTAALWLRSHRTTDLALVPGPAATMNGVISHRGSVLLFHTGLPFDPRRQWGLAAMSAPPDEIQPVVDAAFEEGTTLRLSRAGFRLGRGTIDIGDTTAPPRFTAISVPHWFVLLLTGVPGVFWLRATVRRRRWARQGRCRACGYDLRSSPDRCPECGAAAPPGPAPAAGARPNAAGAVVAAVVCLLGASAPAGAADEVRPNLKRIDELDLGHSTLEQAFDRLRDLTRANIVVRWPALEAAGVSRTAPVRLRLWNIRLGLALDVLLDTAGGPKADLGWAEEDGIITVSTREDVEGLFGPTVYDVRDLIAAMRGPAGHAAGDAEPRTWQEAIDELIMLITDTVEPDTWRDAGGSAGSIREIGGRFIITQSPSAKVKVEQLLGRLRREFSKPALTQPAPAAGRAKEPVTSPSAPPPSPRPAGG